MKMKILDYQDPCYGVLIVYNKRPVVNMDFEYFLKKFKHVLFFAELKNSHF